MSYHKFTGVECLKDNCVLAAVNNNKQSLQIVGQTGNAPQLIYTIDPQLAQLGIPQYPPLPASTDTTKLEEIRRTIAVSNLDVSVSASAFFGRLFL